MAARVDSIDALREFRGAVWKFVETATLTLSDSEAHMQRVQVWLETEQLAYWQGQIRSRTEAVARAKEAVRAKRLFRADEMARPSDIEEQKALRLAISRLEEAEQKLANTKKYIQKLQKEVLLYKGQVQRMYNAVSNELPMAAAHLDHLITKLETYVGLAPAASAASEAVSTAAAPGAEEILPSVKRPEPVEPPAESDPQQEAPDGRL